MLGCLQGLVACAAEAPAPASATTTSTIDDEPGYVDDDGEEQDSEALAGDDSLDQGGAGGMGGAEHSVAGTSASEGGSGGGDALEPSCESLPDGSYCGSELFSPGATNELYQCVGGVVTAAANCPGGCQQGVCTGSTGTSSGSGHGKGK